MNYIGSKFTLLDFLNNSIDSVLKSEKEIKSKNDMVFADLFAGTGCVGGYFKSQGYSKTCSISEKKSALFFLLEL